MEFGRVQESELDKVDFRLPAEPAGNKKILKGKPIKNSKVYVGCAKWGRTEWVGKIYPPKTKERDFLKHYIEHYNCIELTRRIINYMGPGALPSGKRKQLVRIFYFVPRCTRELPIAGN